MAPTSRTMDRLIGLALLMGGLALAGRAFQLSSLFTAQLTRELTGSLPSGVVLRYIAGAISSAAGLYLLLKR